MSPQIKREGLAFVFGVKRFHSYLYGHKFELVTDIKQLITLSSEKKAVSPQASGKIQSWSLTLGMYEYIISFKPTKVCWLTLCRLKNCYKNLNIHFFSIFRYHPTPLKVVFYLR